MNTLYQAIKANNLVTVKKLLDEKPEIIDRAIFRDLTALQIAAREGHLDIVLYLIERGATIDGSFVNPNSLELRRNEVQKTPLYFSLERGHVFIARVLFFCGADLAKAKNTARTEDNRYVDDQTSASNLFSLIDLEALCVGVVLRKQQRVLDYLQVPLKQLASGSKLPLIINQLMTLAAALNHTAIVQSLLTLLNILNIPLIDNGKQRSALYWAVCHNNSELTLLCEQKGYKPLHVLYFLDSDDNNKFWQFFRTATAKQPDTIESYAAYKKQKSDVEIAEHKEDKLTDQELNAYQAAASEATTLPALLQTADISLYKILTYALNNYDYVAVEQLKTYLEKKPALLAEATEKSNGSAVSFLVFNGASPEEHATYLIQQKPQLLKPFLENSWSEEGLLHAIFRKNNKSLFKAFCQQHWHCATLQETPPANQVLVAEHFLRSLQDEYSIDFRPLIAMKNATLEERIRQARLNTTELGLIMEHCVALSIPPPLSSRPRYLADKMPDDIWQHSVTFLSARDYACLSATSRRYHHLANDPGGNKARLKRNKEQGIHIAQQTIDAMEQDIASKRRQRKLYYILLLALIIIISTGSTVGLAILACFMIKSDLGDDVKTPGVVLSMSGTLVCPLLGCIAALFPEDRWRVAEQEEKEFNHLSRPLQNRLQAIAPRFNLQLAHDTRLTGIQQILQTAKIQLRQEIAELETQRTQLQPASPQPTPTHVIDIADITTPLLSTVATHPHSSTFFAAALPPVIADAKDDKTAESSMYPQHH